MLAASYKGASLPTAQRYDVTDILEPPNHVVPQLVWGAMRRLPRVQRLRRCYGPSSTIWPGWASEATLTVPPFACSMSWPCQATKQDAASLL